MTYQLIQGDCLDVIGSLPSASFDAIITDPQGQQKRLRLDCSRSPSPIPQLAEAAEKYAIPQLRMAV